MKRIIVVLIMIGLIASSASCTIILSQTSTTVIPGVTEPGTNTNSILPPTATSSSTPRPTPTPTIPPPDVTVFSPPDPTTATAPSGELVQYVLGLINKDRSEHGLGAVTLGNNSAAQSHAEDMFDNYYLSHWGTDGLKPYMRYTFAGGVNYEGENSAYSGWWDESEDPNLYVTIDPRQELADLEYRMMYDDAASNWGHRNNILNEWHRNVNIGIAYDSHRLTLVEQFEGDYVELTQSPTLEGGILTISGTATLGIVDSVAVFYDPLPKPLTQSELLNGPRSYGLGKQVVTAIPPAPPGYYYTDLPPEAVQAILWDVSDGSFSVKADINDALINNGQGVYTVVVWAKTGNNMVALTNYSLFIR